MPSTPLKMMSTGFSVLGARSGQFVSRAEQIGIAFASAGSAWRGFEQMPVEARRIAYCADRARGRFELRIQLVVPHLRIVQVYVRRIDRPAMRHRRKRG
ncbi:MULTISPECIES: hypothetical protein [Burkholderia cepacia complex]|uniref:hypothetical protein n=1 Tax=Burkholderia cepacia complex TaxID=87882 RepID=UPI001CF370FE|nr:MULTISPECIES: hypothetical protein [Burkholderia cepacia complex]MCA8057359.1 hypothetical protein [Burkholderia cepacia]MDN7535184.1 hypothetical protein [Burkholderia orbicola]